MTSQQSHIPTEHIDESIAKMQRFILQHYPAATFRIERGIDDPEAIHLVTFIDFEDAFDVLDVVSERMMQIQIEDGVPIFVIPMRPHERTLSMYLAREPLPEALLAEERTSPPGPLS